MASERAKRRIERLLDEADEAVVHLDWDTVRARAQAVLAFDPENSGRAGTAGRLRPLPGQNRFVF